MPELLKPPIMMIGPCSVESRGQLLQTVAGAKERGISIIRGGLFKPRTAPGFEGLGLTAAPWVAEVTNEGITFGTEALLPDNVSDLIEAVERDGGDPAHLLFWLGSRNQNHVIQRGIAQRVMKEAEPNVMLMIKNQPWGDENHWLGIVEHVLQTGFPSERVALIHRGFSPYGRENSDNMRNPADFEMAMRVREKTHLPMLLDPSHIAGSVVNVFKVVEKAKKYNFDGLIIEVHPNPDGAQTDKNQQLDFNGLDKLLSIATL